MLLAISAICLLSAPVWAFAFTHIYTRVPTRVQALYWAIEAAPKMAAEAGTPKLKATYETQWDDELPFWISGMPRFRGIFDVLPKLEAYPEDSEEKAERFAAILADTDLFFITSNRLWATLGRMPERYPMMQRFYSELLGCPEGPRLLCCYRTADEGRPGGRLGFRLIKTFTSYPNLGPFELNDQAAEEAFTVYDHPKVFVFLNEMHLPANAIAGTLNEGAP